MYIKLLLKCVFVSKTNINGTVSITYTQDRREVKWHPRPIFQLAFLLKSNNNKKNTMTSYAFFFVKVFYCVKTHDLFYYTKEQRKIVQLYLT